MKPGVLYAVVANFLVNDKYLESFVTQAQADWDWWKDVSGQWPIG
jgi:hypothetical protein